MMGSHLGVLHLHLGAHDGGRQHPKGIAHAWVLVGLLHMDRGGPEGA